MDIRVIRKMYETPEDEVAWLEMHTVSYYADGSIANISEKPLDPHAQTIDGIKDVLQQMTEALKKPVVDFETRQEIV